MKANVKLTGAYLVNGGVNLVLGWLAVSVLSWALPVAWTHNDVPEIPPTFSADVAVMIAIGLLILLFDWAFFFTASGDLKHAATQHRWSKWINGGLAGVTIVLLIADGLVVNDGSFSDTVTLLLNWALWLNGLMVLINGYQAIRQRSLFWYRWGLVSQLLGCLVFWVALFITPA